MKRSITFKVFAYFIGLVSVVLGVIWLGLHFYISEYYYGKKIEDMQAIVKELSDAIDEGDIADLFKLEYMNYQLGGKISIYNDDSVITLNAKYITKKIKHEGSVAYIYTSNIPVQGTQWLLYGDAIGNGKYAVLEVPIEAIENTLILVEKFFSYLVLISIIIAGIFSVILSLSIAKPIKSLNHIAKEMGSLNFKLKYKGKGKDEIGQLGYTLNELTDKLEFTIDELQRELAKEKQLDVLRKSFVAQVSHELQTPLSVINGYVEALDDHMVETDDEKEYYYGIILDETAKMSKMVRELLDLSQLEAGTFKMNMELMDVTGLMDMVFAKYEKMALSKGLQFQYEPMQDTLWAMGDPHRLEQAITNILNNAFKHTIPGGKILIQKLHEGKRLVVTVENEGDPIPEEELAFIWESFYKGKNSDNKGGTGLGLAIASNIFKFHKIEYRAYNTEAGVAFELRIPLSQEGASLV